MAIKVRNNLSAMRSLGQLNINITELGKALTKVSSGQKINSAGDDASGLAISEKMRVRIRALEQDIQNVKNGRAMLNTAEGGLQRQLDLMRTIKAKVIDAANDSNTEMDRQTIQKEIDHHFQEIQDIACETDFNGIKLLIGNEPLRKTVIDWQVLDEPEFVEGSDEMNVIPDKDATRDGIEGPFDTFSSYRSNVGATTIAPLLGSSSTENLRDAGKGTPAEFELDLSNYSLSDLDGTTFYVAGYDEYNRYSKKCYVLTTDASTNYNTRSTQHDMPLIPIQINSVSDAASKIAAAVNSNQGDVFTTSTSGNKVNFTSKNKTQLSNSSALGGFTVTKKNIQATAPSGMPTGTFSAGQASQYHTVSTTSSSGDATTTTYEYIEDQAATPSTFTVDDISSFAPNSGFVVTGYNGRESYVKFVDGTDITTDSDGVICVGLGIVGSGSTKSALLTQLKGDQNGGSTIGISISVDSTGKMTLTSTEPYNDFSSSYGIYSRKDYINNYSVSQLSFDAQENSGTFPATWTRTVDGDDGTPAHYDIDLTAYDTTDAATLESFIDDLKGNMLTLRYRPYTNYPDYYTNVPIEFIDKINPMSINAVPKTNNTVVDLNSLRSAVSGGTTIADAFINLMSGYNNIVYTQPTFSDESANGKKILRVTSRSKGDFGEKDSINLQKENGTLASYAIDYDANWFQNNLSSLETTLDKYLDNKGFRFYCATCAEQWFNVVFSSGEDVEDIPEGRSGADLQTVRINVSSLSDVDKNSDPSDAAARLVKLIYEQGNPQLSHYYSFAADDGVLTIYDTRKEYLSSYNYPNLQQGGLAKITDGIFDDVIKAEKEVPVNEKRLVIQDTDKDSQQIILHIPQSTLSHIFQLSVDNPSDMSRYNVLTKSNRNFLLGRRVVGADAGSKTADKNLGALDKGINYLLDAITLVGSQGARLEMTESNVVTQLENETNSESTIRDADMAKEMTSYTKSNILAQAAQAMLAQANQNSSSVLGLLQ
ncbi:MAG: hypothetical protein IKE46_01985 [Selenomonadaceae bacterium]|nr:hypothetical protein [Selenomonadaceae bacterium]